MEEVLVKIQVREVSDSLEIFILHIKLTHPDV